MRAIARDTQFVPRFFVKLIVFEIAGGDQTKAITEYLRGSDPGHQTPTVQLNLNLVPFWSFLPNFHWIQTTKATHVFP